MKPSYLLGAIALAVLLVAGIVVMKKQPPPISQTLFVTYSDSGFSPSTLTIKKSQTVTFKNEASDDMWVASDPHPIHTFYPTKGGCISSTFDSCKGLHPKESWSFTFDAVGTWGYHNHLDPGEKGTIIVQ